MLQNTRICETIGEESKAISSELASAISDGLYFYEQVGRLFSVFSLNYNMGENLYICIYIFTIYKFAGTKVKAVSS